jgi:Glycine rich protein
VGVSYASCASEIASAFTRNEGVPGSSPGVGSSRKPRPRRVFFCSWVALGVLIRGGGQRFGQLAGGADSAQRPRAEPQQRPHERSDEAPITDRPTSRGSRAHSDPYVLALAVSLTGSMDRRTVAVEDAERPGAFDVWGAQGGFPQGGDRSLAGFGAHVRAVLSVHAHETLTIVGGGGGGGGGQGDHNTGNGGVGGFNGGAGGGNSSQATDGGDGGGGASDIRTGAGDSSGLPTRLLVAGGGGGATGSTGCGQGGAGGPVGQDGKDGCPTPPPSATGRGGGGGTLSAGGTGGASMRGAAGANGALGIGGAGHSDTFGGQFSSGGGGGGGGGYFGGGGGGPAFSR